MDDKHFTFWGSLDVICRMIEEIPAPFKHLWDAGHYRMLPQEVKRMRAYQKRLRKADKAISATLKAFDNLNQK